MTDIDFILLILICAMFGAWAIGYIWYAYSLTDEEADGL